MVKNKQVSDVKDEIFEEQKAALQKVVELITQKEAKIISYHCMVETLLLPGHQMQFNTDYKAMVEEAKAICKDSKLESTGNDNGIISGHMIAVRANGSTFAIIITDIPFDKEEIRLSAAGYAQLIPFNHTGKQAVKKVQKEVLKEEVLA